MSCGDCHGAPAGDTRGGPHGSRNRWLLREPYVVLDGTPESPSTYAACYGCHDRGTILSDTSFEGHSSHVLSASVACGSCHDAHASRDAPGLIQFGRDARFGRVDPSSSGRLEYEPTTRSCYLSCHGVDHDPLGYL